MDEVLELSANVIVSRDVSDPPGDLRVRGAQTGARKLTLQPLSLSLSLSFRRREKTPKDPKVLGPYVFWVF